MNYYEELGLSRAATTEQVRQAYRNLVRLLHPDQHPSWPVWPNARCGGSTRWRGF